VLAKLLNLLPLRTVLIFPFVLEILALTSLVGWLSFRTGQHAITQVAWQIPAEISEQIAQHITQYLTVPQSVHQQFATALQLGLLDSRDTHAITRYLQQQLQRFSAINQLQYVQATAQPAATLTIQRHAQAIQLTPIATEPNATVQIVTDQQAEFPYAGLAFTAQRAWQQPYNNRQGILSIELLLAPLNEFLRDLNWHANERVFIMDNQGLMIAHSTTPSNPIVKQVNHQWQRIHIADSQDALIKASFTHLSADFHAVSTANSNLQTGYFSYLNQRYLWHCRRLHPSPELDWLIVVILPEKRFMQGIYSSLQIHGLLSFAALLIAVAIGLRVSRWIVRPLIQVNDAAHILIVQLPRQNSAKNQSTPWLQALSGQRQDELGQLTHSFNDMVSQLKDSFDMLALKNHELHQLDALKDEFLANTSQELRSPLQGIIQLASQSLPNIDSPEQADIHRNLLMIIASAKRLASLVDDILDLSKLRAHNLHIKPQALPLQTAVATVLTLSHPLVQPKNVQLHSQVASHLPLIYADENRLQQILFNLIGNAIKFTERGSITITAQLYSAISLPAMPSHVQITISDTGIGISADKQEKIFQSFEQGEGSVARQYGGTGLGLAITKQIVELQGGEIWVNSEPGKGSQFHFTLPIAQQPKASSGQTQPNLPLFIESSATKTQTALYVSTVSRSRTNQASQAQSTRLSLPDWEHFNPATFTLLVVDDEPVNLQVLTNYLALAGYELVQATSGQEAISLIEQGLLPDAVLLDVMMPHLNGYEVTTQLRTRYTLTALPILLLTAKTQIKDKIKGLTLGANDYLTKPLRREELLARLRTHLHLKNLQMKNIRMQTELGIAQTLQQLLLPTAAELQAVDELDIAALMLTAAEIGGDYYDVLQKEGQILIGMGDATGHGLQSGVIMLMAQVIIRSLFEAGETDLQQLLGTLNTALYRNIQFRMQTDKNLTLVLLLYAQGEVRISGQHEEIVVLRANGAIEIVRTGQLGFLLGFIADVSEHLAETQLFLQAGDVVVLFTDGITEACDVDGTLYGLQQLCQVLRCCIGMSASEIVEAIMADVHAFIGEQPLADDMSVLVLKRQVL